MTRSNSARSSWRKRTMALATPALLNTTSRPPNRETAASTAACTSPATATSARTKVTADPSARSSAWPASASMSATTTRAPSSTNRSTVARPIPAPPPVTRATFPANAPTFSGTSLNGDAADHAVLLELGNLLVAQAQRRQDLVVVLAEQRSMTAVEPPRPGREASRQRAVAGPAQHRVLDLLEVPARLELRHLALLMGQHHLGHRNAGRPQRAHDLVGRPRRAPGAEVLVDHVVVLLPSLHAAQRLVHSPVGRAQGLDQTVPLVVALHRAGHPGVRILPWGLLGAPVDVLWRRAGAAVARPLQQLPVRRVLDHLFGRDVDGRVDHRRLDACSLSSLAPVLQREQQPCERMHRSIRIADAVGLERLLVGVPGQPGQPRCVLDGVGKGGVVPPRSIESEPWHADDHEVLAQRPQGGTVQADLLEHSWGEVLDHDVSSGDQGPEHLHAPGLVEIDRQALLVRIDGG